MSRSGGSRADRELGETRRLHSWKNGFPITGMRSNLWDLLTTMIYGAQGDRCDRAGGDHGWTIKLVRDRRTPAGQEAFREENFRTVESDREAYAKRIFDTAEELAMGKEVTQEKILLVARSMVAN